MNWHMNWLQWGKNKKVKGKGSCLSSNFHEFNGLCTFITKPLGLCTLILISTPWGVYTPGFAYWCTKLINLQCHHCHYWYHCLLLCCEEAAGWHMLDLPKVPTMTDSAEIRTHDHMIIGTTPQPTLPQWSTKILTKLWKHPLPSIEEFWFQ